MQTRGDSVQEEEEAAFTMRRQLLQAKEDFLQIDQMKKVRENEW